ncbi:hypothetical protein GM418_22485 [Maribellus comscasis]|uniref:Uncharacterized protein n=1 Tax=Maribellus comscasis TaxID=2681766 RepID=A0A6I6JYS8_9BACT|nr:hypothetical protein [Maribellus comscasis]QGY46328.1 hypothetical protein GM418_22485 [Maribellus comscasis]
MKKLLLIFALVAIYGVSVSNASSKILNTSKTEISFVADTDNHSQPTIEDDKKDKKKSKESAKAVVTKTETSSGCTDAQKKSCAASGKSCAASEKSCCSEKKKEEKK